VESTLAVINYGTGSLVSQLLESLTNAQARCTTSGVTLREVLVVDSGFPDMADAAKFIKPWRYPWPVRILENSGHSYSSGVNRAMAAANSEWVFVSNSDVEVIDYAQLQYMVRLASSVPHLAVLCPQLLYPDGSWQRSYGDVPGLLEAAKSAFWLDALSTVAKRTWHHYTTRHRREARKLRPVRYADGAFLLLYKPIFTTLGGFDESFSFYTEEVDYAERARRAGFRVCYLGVSPVVHTRGVTVQKNRDTDSVIRQLYASKLHFVEKYHGSLYVELYQRMLLAGAYTRSFLCDIAFLLTGNHSWHSRATASKRLLALLKDSLVCPAQGETRHGRTY